MGNSPCDYDENGNPEILGQPVVIPNNIIYCYIFSWIYCNTILVSINYNT